jgi:hypothetical protein
LQQEVLSYSENCNAFTKNLHDNSECTLSFAYRLSFPKRLEAVRLLNMHLGPLDKGFLNLSTTHLEVIVFILVKKLFYQKSTIHKYTVKMNYPPAAPTPVNIKRTLEFNTREVQ